MKYKLPIIHWLLFWICFCITANATFHEEYRMAFIGILGIALILFHYMLSKERIRTKVKVVNHSGNALPEYATAASAGMDMRAYLESPLVVEPGQQVMVPTGLYVEIPVGYELQVRPRSGLAAKNGITVLNSPGTVDSDYRGELKVILINHSQQAFTINNGDRIAQMVLAKHEIIEWKPMTSLSETQRGEGGFGHTGKN